MGKTRIRSLFILGLIIGLSTFLYSYKLSVIPNGFYVDEAAVAYNAYSITETGKDIFAQPYPVLFRLLGSYTPPLFIYISAVFIKILGNEIYVFRSISVVSALISVVFFYLLVKKLDVFKSDKVNLAVTLLYAITPWLVFNARLGYETTLAYLLFNIGVYFLFSALNGSKNLLWGILFMSLSTYAAHTQRFLVPIFCILYFIFFAKTIFQKKNLKILILSFIVTLVIQIPHFTVITTPAFWVKNDRLLDPGAGRIMGNIINQTFSYLSTKNLFYELSDIDAQHTIPGISVMYNWMIIPYLIGLFCLFFRIKEKNIRFLLLLFITALIPAALSGEFISIQRALPFLLPLMIVIGLGFDVIFRKVPSNIFSVLFIFLSLYSLLMLYRSYFVLFPIERAYAWNYGYSQVADFIKQNPNTQILLDNSRNPRNYILLLYHLKYPPGKYQTEVDNKYKIDYYKSLPTEDKYNFSKIEVRVINWEKDSYTDQIIIGDPLSVSENQMNDHFLEKVFEIRNPQKNPIMIFYKTNPAKKCLISPTPLCTKIIL